MLISGTTSRHEVSSGDAKYVLKLSEIVVAQVCELLQITEVYGLNGAL